MKRLLVLLLLLPLAGCERPVEDAIEEKDIAHAERLARLEFTRQERELLLADVREQAAAYQALRDVELPNQVPLPLVFQPAAIADMPALRAGAPRWSPAPAIDLPARHEALAFYSVSQLAHLLRTRQVTSVKLTRFFIERLRRHDPQLHAVVTLTEELALAQARRADAEIAAGNYRGPLHGIPYGAKDLFAVPGYPTTWGAMPYRDQVLDETATVVEKLEQAGAVLVAKLSLGALAWGDVWFDGRTRNPWNLEQGSSGSSAGSAAAVAAGLVPFAIGSETWGSIVAPASRVGVTGLRPSFGRVSRHGAMTLSWSMDKIGPLCRTVEDCALVFDAIRGPDGRDASVVEAPFAYAPRADLAGLRVGYLADDFAGDYPGAALDRDTLESLRDLGAELVPMSLPDLPINAMSFVLAVEAAAAFDALTRSNRDDLLVRQVRDAWPNVFRASRLVPAVEYVQANRVRHLLLRQWDAVVREADAYVAPALTGDHLLASNLTGHPCIVVPNGFTDADSPHSITFCGKLYDEATVLAVAKVYQDAVDFDERRPPLFAGRITTEGTEGRRGRN